ncbi:MAG: O-antigen ligase family protein [bacterium]|nr:O-antigen ligase family protein [bacterium]
MKYYPISLKIIHFAFGALFFLTPLIFYPLTNYFPFPWILLSINPLTFELFEFNKMFFVYGITIIITTAWLWRCVSEGKILLGKSFMDYPIIFYLVSQMISTVISIDRHTSVWGYYSRFHGGLVSTVCYVLLYFAFITFCKNSKLIYKYIKAIVFSAFVVSLYGIAQHYGVDSHYWVQNVKARVFSSLGQPNWLAAYLVAVIPLSLSLFIYEYRRSYKILYLVASLGMFLAFLFTASRSGLLALSIELVVFATILVWRKHLLNNKFDWHALIKIIGLGFVVILGYLFVYYKYSSFAVLSSIFTLGVAFAALFYATEKRTRLWIGAFGVASIVFCFLFASPDTFRFNTVSEGSGKSIPIAQEAGGTETGQIRFIVWKGALEIFNHYPIFGSGVETFAYSFYKYRPVELLNTAEWDFLYNKAHNEFINILANTGLFGLGIYLYFVIHFMIFGYRSILHLSKSSEDFLAKNLSQALPIKNKPGKISGKVHEEWNSAYYSLLIASGLISGMVGILITNFFGFSVVIIGIFFFLFPALLWGVNELSYPTLNIRSKILSFIGKFPLKFTNKIDKKIKVIPFALVLLLGTYLMTTLTKYWFADIAIAEARSLRRDGKIGKSYPLFIHAYKLRQREPFYLSEIGWTEANIVHSLMGEDDRVEAAKYVDRAEVFSVMAVTTSPNNVNYWKKLADVYYQLSFFDATLYNDKLRKASDRTRTLAPTDVSTLIILSDYYERIGDAETAIKIMRQSLEWKPMYAQGWYRLGEIYNNLYIKEKLEQDSKSSIEYLNKARELERDNEQFKQGY